MIRSPILLKRMFGIVRQPVFLSLALIGNSFIVLCALLIYFLEHGQNEKIKSFLDALWWSVTTVTTVGYGDIIPVTITGKVLGMGMMLMGATLFCSFSALFAASLLSEPLEAMKKDVKKLESELRSEEDTLDQHLSEIENVLIKMKDLRGRNQNRD